VQLSNLSAFEEVAIVQGPTVMTSSSACATADVAKSMTKESAADLRMATPLRKLQDRRCQNRSNHVVRNRLKLYDVLEDRIDDPVTNEIELRANRLLHLRKIAELVDSPLA
jgi:hypothetical protein